MKLRIQDNSLRFRLTQKEVARLKEHGLVEAEVRFTADRALSYSVTSIRAIKDIEVEYTAGCVRVLLPRSCVLAWAESDQVSIVSNGQVQVLKSKRISSVCTARTAANRMHGRIRWPNRRMK